MQTSDFDYNLPSELIATHPVSPRDSSRLLVLGKESGEIEHKHFYDVIDYLNPGDMLVFNNSKVIPARLIGKKKESGGQVEVFLHKKIFEDNKSDVKELEECWECLLKGKNIKVGLEIVLSDRLECVVLQNNEDGTWVVEFSQIGEEFLSVIEEIGEVPLPPYVVKQRNLDSRFENLESSTDNQDYQTVYSDDDKKGSVAAPTAGLHFTPELIQKIKDKGIKIEYITLHVGMGTFAPVKVDDASKHKMHAEWVEISKETIQNIFNTKINNGKIFTVGTTSTRSLEALASHDSRVPIHDSKVEDFKQDVDIFIYPGYKFQLVDAMITNFHLPKSTLMMLVSAMSSKENIDKAYAEAIREKYRFYSYGDAMLII